MTRKEFFRHGGRLLVSLPLFGVSRLAGAASRSHSAQQDDSSAGEIQPLAIAMWDFSWIERCWPGAGYEDWDQALDQLKERGYNAVRIDAFPHLVAYGPRRTWTLAPVWNQQDWGSPALNRVQIQPGLNRFISKCRKRGIRVALSTWFRRDADRSHERIQTPEELGKIWKATLDSIAEDDLLESILYVDFCNEYPLPVWTPWFPEGSRPSRLSQKGRGWMTRSLDFVRSQYPDLSYTFSFTTEYETWEREDVSFLDLLELHLWMTHFSDFYQQVGYSYQRFESTGYENLVEKGEKLYRQRADHWKASLRRGIEFAAGWSRASGKPLITTECWAVVDYKDWPLLSWDWIKELCEFGVVQAARAGRWIAIATSNFCGPQFVGMWRDVAWHQRLTKLIKSGSVSPDLSAHPAVRRMAKTGRL